MKKIILFSISASMLLFACNNNNASKNATEEVVETVEEVATANNVVDGSSAQTALDYLGTYKGVLPTASGEGMDVTITLTDSTYTKDITYVGKKEKMSSSGKYVWNKEGNTITLEGSEKPNQYFVGENTLTQLNMDGDKITGAIADQYILRK